MLLNYVRSAAENDRALPTHGNAFDRLRVPPQERSLLKVYARERRLAGVKSGEKWIDAGKENEAGHKKGTPITDDGRR